MDTTLDWPELLRHPGARDHMVQVYQDRDFLIDAVSLYVCAGLRAGEAAIVIVRPETVVAWRSLDQAQIFSNDRL